MNNMKQISRIIIASTGVDPHDQGMKVISHALRDASMEVIYLGRFQTPEMVVNTATQENADIIGISDHMGSMVLVAEEILSLLKKAGKTSTKVVAGGLLSDEDITVLEGMGIIGNWVGGTPIHEIVDCVTGLKPV